MLEEEEEEADEELGAGEEDTDTTSFLRQQEEPSIKGLSSPWFAKVKRASKGQQPTNFSSSASAAAASSSQCAASIGAPIVGHTQVACK
jgi:hypothetical protein